MREYKKPIFLIEPFATNEYVASCGTEITKIPQQEIKCIATCSTTVFGEVAGCANKATLQTVTWSGHAAGTTAYYDDAKTAATDIYDGILGNLSNGQPSSSRGNCKVTVGAEYVVWQADADHAKGAKHANLYNTIKETIQKS